MSFEPDLEVVWNFTIALLIGALIGIERERHKRAGGKASIGGLRTFTLFALIGAIAGWLALELDSAWIVVAALLATAALVLAGYALTNRTEPLAAGLTTELAGVVTCLLGVMATLGYRELAVAVGVIVASALAYRQPLHGLVDKLGSEDIYAGLRLLIATFIILPLLPNRAVDPWGALNPRSLWLLVLLISSLSLVGYVATRLLGTSRGILLTGLSGGLVSSTAVTLSFARQSREPAYARAGKLLTAGILVSWSVMFARILIEVLVVNAELLAGLAAPLGIMGAIAIGFTWYYSKDSTRTGSAEDLTLRNPFSLRSASKFAAFFALILLLVRLVELYAPGSGMYFLAALSGAADVDAITLSMAQYARAGDEQVAANAIIIAALSNTLVKAGMVVVLGSPQIRGPIITATLAIIIGGAATLALV